MRNDAVRRRGSWIAAVALLVLLAPPAIAHDGEHHGGKQETGWPGSAKAQEVARAFIADSQPAQDLPAESGGIGCDGGSAAGYPCNNVTLQSFLPLADIGGGKGNDVWGWTDPASGKEYAIMGRTTGTSFVDISDATNPRYLGNLPTTRFASTWRDIKVYRNHAFIVSESRNHGMQVFDLRRLRNVTSPLTFSADANYSGFTTAHNIFINEDSGFAYAVGTNTCSGGLHVVDISAPKSPTQAGCYAGDGYSHDVQCVNPDPAQPREICFASNEDTLTIVDVTNKSAPVQLARVDYPGASYTHQGWLTEDQRYFLIDDELDEGKGINTRTYVFDVADPAAARYVGTHVGTNPAIDHNQYIVGNYSYQANYRSGLRILDISGVATASLSEVAYFDIYPADDAPEFNGAWSTYPFFASGNVVVSGIEQGLFVLRPQLGATDASPSVSVTAPADGATVSGSVAVAADATDDVQVDKVEFFVDGSTIGADTDRTDGWSASWDTTTVADGPHNVTAKATDSVGQSTTSAAVGVTVDNVDEPSPSFTHVRDLSGSSTSTKKNWSASVTITIVDSSGAPVADATVTGNWSHGSPPTSSCTTDAGGQCSVASGALPKRQAHVTFAVTDVGHATLEYDAARNVETSITVAKP